MTLNKSDLADILKAQLEKALRKFEEKHNKTHKSIYLELTLREREEPANEPWVAVRVELHIKNNGVSKLAYGKTLAAQRKETADARLTLYQDLLLNLIGMGIILNLVETIPNETSKSVTTNSPVGPNTINDTYIVQASTTTTTPGNETGK